ncbi:MAG TPA: hypothetical protein VEU33_04485 [Archangium sp.]|nr:hypothetical protein [Archangium sp.]
MQITLNTTGMQAGISVAADKDARDYCVVVVKGTFETNPRGEMTLAREQRTLVAADEHRHDQHPLRMRLRAREAADGRHRGRQSGLALWATRDTIARQS